MIHLAVVRRHWFLIVLAVAGCKRSQAQQQGEAAADPRVQAEVEQLAQRRAIVVVGGEERVMDAAEAQKQGFTLVSLRDDWTPYIFQEIPGPDGKPLPNRYRTIYLGMANDISDGDGQPLVQPPDKTGKKKPKAPEGPPVGGGAPASSARRGGGLPPPELSIPPPHNYM